MRTVTRPRQPRARSWLPLILVALALAITAGAAYGLRGQHAPPDQSARVIELTDRVLGAWRTGTKDPVDHSPQQVRSVASWTIHAAMMGQKGTRAAVATTIDSATKDGTPIRYNWTLYWMKTAAGWEMRKLVDTDGSPSVDAWDGN